MPDSFTDFQDIAGYQYIHPAVQRVRYYFEGIDAEVCPENPDIRWMIPKEWHIEQNQILVFIGLAVLISIVAPIANRFLFTVITLLLF